MSAEWEGRPIWKRLSAVLLVFLVCAVGSSCTGRDENVGRQDGSIDLPQPEAQAEYDRAFHEMTLPRGVPWPPLAFDKNGMRIVYDKGQPREIAQGHYLCLWEGEWVQEFSIDKTRAATALKQLIEFKKMDKYTTGFDAASRDFFDKYLKQARLGDPSGFRRDVELNC